MTAFSDAGFDPKAWVNKALRSQASDSSKSADVSCSLFPHPPFSLFLFFTVPCRPHAARHQQPCYVAARCSSIHPCISMLQVIFLLAPLIFLFFLNHHSCGCFFRCHPIRSRRHQPSRWMQDYASQVVMKLQMFIQGVTTEPVNQ